MGHNARKCTLGQALCVDPDRSAHPRGQLKVFLGRLVNIVKESKFLQVASEDFDQTARMRRLICLRWAHTSECTFSYFVNG